MNTRPRVSDLGVKIGILEHGEINSITDVENVSVGNKTLIKGSGKLTIGSGPIRTGVTAILPHQENIFQKKITGYVHVLNGFGKAIGFSQVKELGVIESPILLTNTLNSWTVADALVDYTTGENKGVFSFNPIVGECNDSFLNDIIGRHIKSPDVIYAIKNAKLNSCEEGSIGAGTGMTGFGWKGGIGTSSRICEIDSSKYTVGCLTLTNTGDPREFRIGGIQIGKELLPPKNDFDPSKLGGSIIMVIATNAPVTSRQLGRISRRASLGLARAGGIADHSSGDFIIAFSNSEKAKNLDDSELTPLMRGVIESTEEAVINSVLKSDTMTGRDGNTRIGIPIDQVTSILAKYNVI
ncbi:MAG: P1 family peptidase [SAR202 cluster bacterium]|nr:P1 family peptidase [SAR202 cluster bacterium]|tara:strand:+ start:27641 stop:28699 length:1059 start_codon:yes stop_codon:yes gene_type:complete